MATQSLYRRYRPRRFAELKGQEHVVRALRNSVAKGRVGQAYLFSGPRGTGKTSTARILAKVLNCENSRDGEPCCECASCLAVEQGISYDVHELDAASNNGVDAMRDLIDKASLGTPGQHKVYILDEAHMLSKGAEAALLKTLEEPPPHVVFVLATTDPKKMSDTIRSRAQHLQFHLLNADTLYGHVRWVSADAELDVSESSIQQVLAQGGGSVRDTLSALELVASAGDDAIDVLTLDEFVEAMIDHDPGRALTMVATAVARGRDSRNVTAELIGFLRNGLLALMAPELVQDPTTRIDAMTGLARRLGPAGLVRGIETLGSALTEMRHAPDPRVLLDVAIVRLTSDRAGGDLSSVLDRLDRLERRLGRGATSPPENIPTPVREDTEVGSAPAAEHKATGRPSRSTQRSQAPIKVTVEDWNRAQSELKGMARAVFAPAEFVESALGHITLGLPNDTHRDKCEQHRPAAEAAVVAVTGSPVVIELVTGSSSRNVLPSGGGATSDGASRVDSVVSPDRSTPPLHPGDRRSGHQESPTGNVTATGSAFTAITDRAVTAEKNDPPRVQPPPDRESAPHRQEIAKAERVAGEDTTTITPDGGRASPSADGLFNDQSAPIVRVDDPSETVRTPLDRLVEAFPGSVLIDDI